MTQLLLTENNNLALYVEDENKFNQLMKSAKFKIRLRRYVDKIAENNVFFKSSITIHDIKKVKSAIVAIFPETVIDEKIEVYIEDRNYFIQSRYRLGNDIKKKELKFSEPFEEFSTLVNRQMIRPLTEVQMWNAFYMYVMRNVSNFSVPGSGKTATVLGTFAYLKEKTDINKIVMIGPKNSFGSWIYEYRFCFGLDLENYYFNLHDKAYNTPRKRQFALRFDSGSKELTLLNYESLQSLQEVLTEIIDDKVLLVFDEVHKIKNPAGQRATVALEVSKGAGAIIALTGTPIPNSYQDIYNVLNILYREDYRDFFGFSTRELKNAGPNEISNINEKIRPFFCRISKEDLQVPEVNEDKVMDIQASKPEEVIFKILFQAYKNNMFALLVRILQLESNPQLLLKKINQDDFKAIIDDESDFSEDVMIQDYREDIVHYISQIKRTTKTQKTIELIKQLTAENKKVIVWCVFIASIRLLEAICSQLGIKVKCIYGGVPLEERQQLIDEFRKGEIDVLITNPHTLAESVSLHMVCHDAIYYEYSFNLVHLLQSKDRIHRLGLPKDQYTQYYFMKNNYVYNEEHVSIDGRIYDRLKEKENTMLDAINNDVLEHVTSYEEDLELIFENLQ